MKISQVNVKNFRCLSDILIPFENLTALVGRNGSGKSSILKAIQVFYDVNYSVSLEDYCNRNGDDQIEIKITFKEFTPKEEALYGNYIDENSLTITKRIDWNDGNQVNEYYASTRQIPIFAEIRNIRGLREIQNRIREIIALNQFEGLEGSFRSADDGLAILTQYEQDNPELTVLTESRFQFMGARNVGGGSLDTFTRFVFLPAVKEATEEVEGRASPIGQLISAIISTEIANREDLLEFKERINQEIQEMYTPENLGGLNEVAEDISNLLGVYAPNSELKIKWGELNPVQIGLPPVLYSLVEDNFEGDISYKGHGL